MRWPLLWSLPLLAAACGSEPASTATAGAAGAGNTAGSGGTGGSGATAGTGGSGATGNTGGTTGSGGFVASDCGAAALKDLAESAAPGTFTELTAPGYDSALLDAGGGHHILQYSDKGVWDPNTCQALFVGGGHLSLLKYIALSASTNQWLQAPNPSWWCDPATVQNPYQCATHGYQHDALDPATGTFYFRFFNDKTVRRHQVDATIDSDWDTIPDLPGDAAGCIATSLEYFPDRDELVYVSCNDQSLRTWKPGAAAWSTVPGPFDMGPYHNYGVYNPVHQLILFGLGNGSTGVHRYATDGTVTQAAPPPRTFHPSPDDKSILRILTVDPASGKYLAVAPNGDMFEYDVPADQWTALALKAPEELQVAIPVTSYGVVLFLGLAPAKVYLYKH